MKHNKLQKEKSNKNINVFKPALVFLIVNQIVYYLQTVQSGGASLSTFLIALIVYHLITQVLAYITCFIVIKSKKGQKGVWINYIAWSIFLSIGTISGMLNK